MLHVPRAEPGGAIGVAAASTFHDENAPWPRPCVWFVGLFAIAALMHGVSGGAAHAQESGSDGQTGIPSDACWKYDSSTMSEADVSRWNGLAARQFLNQGLSNFSEEVDPDLPYELFTNRDNQPCTMTQDGAVRCVRQSTDNDPHSVMNFIGLHGSHCADTGQVLVMERGRPFRWGYLMCVPAPASWMGEVSWVVLTQVPQTNGGGNPPVAVVLKGNGASGASLHVKVRGDARDAQVNQDLATRQYQFEVDEHVYDLSPGRCYDMRHEVVIDERAGGDAQFVLWIEGERVYDLRQHVGSRAQVGYGGGMTNLPSFGTYAYDLDGGAIELHFDKLWTHHPG